MILLDTHVALWLRAGDRRLGARARVEIDRAWQVQEVAVSAFSFWEMEMLRAKSRIDYPQDIGVWRLEQLRQGLVEIPVTGDIAIRANALLNFHPDPADRIIVATAMAGHQLVTADRRILEWSGTVQCLNAAQ